MAGGAGEEGAGKKALVIDTNVIISSMIKEAGYTRTILLILTASHPSYTPEYALREIEKYAGFLAERKNIPFSKQKALLKIVTGNIEIVKEGHYKEEIERARLYVNDPGDMDFVALAIKLQERYTEVVILTYNRKDYKVEELMKRGVRVLTPAEAVRILL